MLILIVEDNPENRELLREALTYDNHDIVEAVNGEEALETMRVVLPDLVLLDIQMPKLDGYEVIRRVRADEVLKGTRVVALTALAMRGERERALAAGFDGYISKPISFALLDAEVEKAQGKGRVLTRRSEKPEG
jgi:two-component system cell cycle response regulator DivK